MPRLSIIVPVLGCTSRLETTLVSVLEHRPSDCEVIVVLDTSYEDPYDLSGEVQFVEAQGAVGLAGSINSGIQASRGNLVHVLAAGLEVCEGWAEYALPHFRDPRVAAVAPLVHDVLDRREILAAGVDYSPRRGRIVRTVGVQRHEPSEVLGPIAQAGFFRRAALELVGHFPTSVGDNFTDVDLALTLQYAGYRALLEPQSVVEAIAGDLCLGPTHGLRFGLSSERLFWRTAGVIGWRQAMAGHLLGTITEFVCNLPRPRALSTLAGRLIGACALGAHRAHRQWLIDVERASQSLLRGTISGHLRVDCAHPTPRAASETVVSTAPATIS